MESDNETGQLIRMGMEADAAVVGKLHASQIGEGFLSSLGPEFLRLLYRRIARTPSSFFLIAEQDSAIIGFIAGATDVAALYRAFVWHDGLRAALLAGRRLLRSWSSAVETLRHGGGEAGEGVELLSIAVSPNRVGRGTGGLLVGGFLDEIERRGIHASHVVVAAHNRVAIALYQRAGFHTVEEFELHAGTTSLLMQRTPFGRAT
jgi:ribosomal protein S18 acetylase RimI-like enzyme